MKFIKSCSINEFMPSQVFLYLLGLVFTIGLLYYYKSRLFAFRRSEKVKYEKVANRMDRSMVWNPLNFL